MPDHFSDQNNYSFPAKPPSLEQPSLWQLLRQPPGSLDINFPAVRVAGAWSLLALTLRVFFKNLSMIGKIFIILFLPYEVAANFLTHLKVLDGPAKGLSLVVYALLEAIFIPSLIYALLAVFREGTAPPLIQSLRWGVRQCLGVSYWRVKASLRIILGLLFFIIPGIVLLVRYTFVETIVSVEGNRQRLVLDRSREIAQGHGWMIFFSGLLAVLLSCSFIFILNYLLIAIAPENSKGNWIVKATENLVVGLSSQFIRGCPSHS